MLRELFPAVPNIGLSAAVALEHVHKRVSSRIDDALLRLHPAYQGSTDEIDSGALA